MIRLVSSVVAAVVLIGLPGCSRPSPEEQVRKTLAVAVAAAHDRDLNLLRDLVSPDYQDAEGRNRAALIQLVALYLNQTDTLFIRTRTTALEIAPSDEAHATVLAAIADVPLEDMDLEQLSADFVSFELTLRRQGGTWKLTSSSWQSISATEFLQG